MEISGRSKGYGIVEFSSVDDAQDAISQLNGEELCGRPINVREDRDAAQTLDQISGAMSGVKVYVGNLPWDVRWQVSDNKILNLLSIFITMVDYYRD